MRRWPSMRVTGSTVMCVAMRDASYRVAAATADGAWPLRMGNVLTAAT
jgi:hypothetical protein